MVELQPEDVVFPRKKFSEPPHWTTGHDELSPAGSHCNLTKQPEGKKK